VICGPIGCAVDFVCRLLHLKIISLKNPLQIGLCNKAVWKGNLSIKQDTFSYLTDEYEIMLYSLNIQMKDQLSNSSEEDTICADWREGELW
ncbi:hypothetical protein ABTD48_18875, partial [Acinetobacter baumannii]